MEPFARVFKNPRSCYIVNPSVIEENGGFRFYINAKRQAMVQLQKIANCGAVDIVIAHKDGNNTSRILRSSDTLIFFRNVDKAADPKQNGYFCVPPIASMIDEITRKHLGLLSIVLDKEFKMCALLPTADVPGFENGPVYLYFPNSEVLSCLRQYFVLNRNEVPTVLSSQRRVSTRNGEPTTERRNTGSGHRARNQKSTSSKPSRNQKSTSPRPSRNQKSTSSKPSRNQKSTSPRPSVWAACHEPSLSSESGEMRHGRFDGPVHQSSHTAKKRVVVESGVNFSNRPHNHVDEVRELGVGSPRVAELTMESVEQSRRGGERQRARLDYDQSYVDPKARYSKDPPPPPPPSRRAPILYVPPTAEGGEHYVLLPASPNRNKYVLDIAKAKDDKRSSGTAKKHHRTVSSPVTSSATHGTPAKKKEEVTHHQRTTSQCVVPSSKPLRQSSSLVVDKPRLVECDTGSLNMFDARLSELHASRWGPDVLTDIKRIDGDDPRRVGSALGRELKGMSSNLDSPMIATRGVSLAQKKIRPLQGMSGRMRVHNAITTKLSTRVAAEDESNDDATMSSSSTDQDMYEREASKILMGGFTQEHQQDYVTTSRGRGHLNEVLSRDDIRNHDPNFSTKSHLADVVSQAINNRPSAF
eukprot:GHVH01007910.1.p1 GENE.GHVH01007910.1~~GHVH01007910.1.p1  ORF type:complete len:641 (+),score=64.42 GHVH01007910.1:81-2003(+)